jgi:hypothetical protein
MAREDLTLNTGLIRKGEARGQSPAVAAVVEAEEAPPRSLPGIEPARPRAVQPPEQPSIQPEADDPPLRAVPPSDVPKRFTSFRLPVSLDEDLRAMIYETRRTKQDLLIEFVASGVENWKRSRRG